MSTRIYKTWVQRVLGGEFSKYQCNQWAQAVVPLSEGEQPRGKKTVLTENEARALRVLIKHYGGVTLTDEHTKYGLEWMRKHADLFPEQCLTRFSHFTFQGDGHIARSNEWWVVYVPVWRIHTLDGETLDYAAASWQSTAYSRSGPLTPVILPSAA